MQYKASLETYAGRIREVVIGREKKLLRIGGADTFPFHSFEGSLPNPPQFALEVYDTEPEGWSKGALEPFKDVVADPVRWARKCVENYGAELVCLQLLSTDPGGKNTSAEEAAELTRQVMEAINVPLIVYGSGADKKDLVVLSKVAEVCSGGNLLLGPLKKENYEEIARAALEYGHCIIAQAFLDINLQKELHIKLCKFFPVDKIVIDPLSAALGYGMEYGFSIMERIKQVGIVHKDAMMQMPIIANLGKECWKTKEAKKSERQGILWEGITALSLLLAGADVVVLRHPETYNLMKKLTRNKGSYSVPM